MIVPVLKHALFLYNNLNFDFSPESKVNNKPPQLIILFNDNMLESS